jgi:hypothetical protein
MNIFFTRELAKTDRPVHQAEAFWHFVKAGDLGDFNETAIASGTSSLETAYVAGAIGQLKLANASSANNSGCVRLSPLGFGIETGQELYAKGRFRLSEPSSSEFRFGFADLASAWITGASLDAIHVAKASGSRQLSLQVYSNGTASSVSSIYEIPSTATWFELMLAIRAETATQGKVSVIAGLYSASTGTWQRTNAVVDREFTNLPGSSTRGNLGVGVAFQSGAASDMTCLIDYIGVGANVLYAQ